MSTHRPMAPLFAPAEVAPGSPEERVLERLRPFFQRGVLAGVDVHVAAHLCRRTGLLEPDLVLALALAVRAPRRGHVCVDLDALTAEALLPEEGEAAPQGEELPPLELPGPGWAARVAGARALVRAAGEDRLTPFVLEGSLLYTERYFGYQQTLAHRVKRWTGPKGRMAVADEDRKPLTAGLTELFRPPPRADGAVPPEQDERLNLQRAAAAVALVRRFAVITGGPGMGKTWALRNILALFWLRHRARWTRGEVTLPAPAVLLAAPTGKAANRMRESLRQGLSEEFAPALARVVDDPGEREALRRFLQELPARTLHRTLGFRRDNPTRFRHHREAPLEADLLIVDEASMVDLAMFAKLVDAVGEPGPSGEPTRLILIGDRNQLSSVEAGTVLADLCGPTVADTLRLTPSLLDELQGTLGLDLRAAANRATDVALEEVDGPPVREAVVQLRRTFRFGEESHIGRFAAACTSERFDAARAAAVLDRPPGGGADVALYAPPRRGALPEALREVVLDGYRPYLDLLRGGFSRVKGAAFPTREVYHRRLLEAFDRFRLLCVHRRGRTGVEGLNREVLALLRDENLVRESGTWWRGRPVLIQRNDYTVRLGGGGRGLFNGDIGLLVTVPRGDRRHRVVVFPGVDALPPADDPADPPPLDPADVQDRRLVVYAETTRLPEHQTALAMTIHKSQGSEFEHVLLVLPHQHSPLLSRELIYTGVTRAKKRMTMVGTVDLLQKGLESRVQRASGLGHQLW